jgi:hypothetical protein
MRNWRRRGVLLAVGAALAIAGLASAWAMGAGSSERQQDTLHNCPATGVWERFGVDGGRCWVRTSDLLRVKQALSR